MGPDPIFFCGKGSTEQGKTSSHQIPYSYLSDGAEIKEWEANNFPENNVPGLHNWSYHGRNNYKIIKNSLTGRKSPAFFNAKNWHLKNSRGIGQERRSNNTIKDKTFPIQLKTRTEQKLKKQRYVEIMIPETMYSLMPGCELSYCSLKGAFLSWLGFNAAKGFHRH